MRVAWLAPYPVETLAPALVLARRRHSHPCSWIVALSEALAERPDIELHLLTASPWAPKSQTVTRDNIIFHVIRDAVPLTNRGWPPWLAWSALTGFAGLSKRFGEELRRIAPDVVHAHGTEYSYAVAGLRSGFPCVISMQGIMGEIAKVWRTTSTRRLARQEETCVRACRYFVCRTTFDSGFVQRQNPAAKIFFIHEAMRPEFFQNNWEARDEETLLYVGALDRHKRLDLLLTAVARLPSARLAVIGAGNPSPWKAVCDRLGISRRVEFLGFRNAEQIAEQHRRAQVFVLPSQIENSPNALAEAMVSGMPVVATVVGGVPSMVEDGVTGRLVPFGDVGALAEVLAALLKQPTERRRLGENARHVARERHAPARVAEATERTYREIIEGR